MKRELFVLSPNIWPAIFKEEISPTIRDMNELGLWHLPYEKIDLLVNFGGYEKFGKDAPKAILYRGLEVHGKFESASIHHEGRWHAASSYKTIDNDPAIWFAGILVVLLATRNADKKQKNSKLSKLGIGTKSDNPEKQYDTVTTISCPTCIVDNDEEHPPTGRTCAPHLRRGHIRRQHYGPNNALVKKVWIEPMFVNADPEWISNRRRYNVSVPSSTIH